jgi:glycosyltransferase involved in cell wall biosynthesis
MGWSSELILITRHLIGELCGDVYSDDRIEEILVADGGSDDELDEILINYFPTVTKYNLDRTKSNYNHIANCPAWEYNFLVSKAKNDIIIKIDPEVIVIGK